MFLMSRRKECEIYYEEVDPDRRALWKALMRVYYHKVGRKEILDFLIYHRGYSDEEAYTHMMKIRKERLKLVFIKVKDLDFKGDAENSLKRN